MVIHMDNNAILDLARKKKKVFDQTASMYFTLSDEYKRLSNLEDAIEIIASVLLCGVTFLDCEKYFHISSNASSLIIGFISIFLLAFTLIKQSLGHKQLFEKHQLAGKMYAKAKLDLASKITEWEINPISDSELLAYLDDHYNALSDLPQIPEKHFGRLKHAHQVKVELSKFLDSHPNDFWLVCKIKFRLGIDLPSKKKVEKGPASEDNMNS